MADGNRTVAGKYHVNIGGQRFEITGECTLDVSEVSRDAQATSSGRMSVVEKAELHRAKCKFTRFDDADPTDAFASGDPINVTFVEEATQKRHLFTQAVIVGKPTLNLATGEVDGIEIATDNYTVTG